MAEISIEIGSQAVSSKRVLYVGGLAENTTVQLLRAAMIPFGPIHSVDMVRYIFYDPQSGNYHAGYFC